MALTEHVKRELALLKKKHGEERSFLKSDPFYPDYLRALEIAEEVKVLKADKKTALDALKKQAAAAVLA